MCIYGSSCAKCVHWDRIPQNVFNCVSAVRMASSGSTRELALKMTSSALLMSRNGKQSSQFPLGWGHLQFCEFTQSWWLRVPYFPLVCKRYDVLIQYYLKRSPTECLKMYLNWYFPILGIQPFLPSSVITWRLLFLIIVTVQWLASLLYLFEISKNNIKFLPSLLYS